MVLNTWYQKFKSTTVILLHFSKKLHNNQVKIEEKKIKKISINKNQKI